MNKTYKLGENLTLEISITEIEKTKTRVYIRFNIQFLELDICEYFGTLFTTKEEEISGYEKNLAEDNFVMPAISNVLDVKHISDELFSHIISYLFIQLYEVIIKVNWSKNDRRSLYLSAMDFLLYLESFASLSYTYYHYLYLDAGGVSEEEVDVSVIEVLNLSNNEPTSNILLPIDKIDKTNAIYVKYKIHIEAAEYGIPDFVIGTKIIDWNYFQKGSLLYTSNDDKILNPCHWILFDHISMQKVNEVKKYIKNTIEGTDQYNIHKRIGIHYDLLNFEFEKK